MVRLNTPILAGFGDKIKNIAEAVLKHKSPLKNMLNAIPNRMDHSRRKLIGPEHSCAEWLLRTGACVRWKSSAGLTRSYSALPSASMQENMMGNKLEGVDPAYRDKWVIEEVYAEEAAFSSSAFDHFDGCKGIKKMKFVRCDEFSNTSLTMLSGYKGVTSSLEHLAIDGCDSVSAEGLKHVPKFRELKTLELTRLKTIKQSDAAVSNISAALPNCQVQCEDLG